MWMKNMVFVPSIHPPTPCANLPNSFAPAFVQISLCLGSRSNWRYSSNLPVSQSRTGLADSRRRWSTRSAMEDDGVPLLLLTLSAIDSEGMIVGCLRMGCGDVTINLGGAGLASGGISSLRPISNCTRGGVSTCNLGGAAICTLGDVSTCTLGEWAWSGI